jgi:rhomboid protease GluP
VLGSTGTIPLFQLNRWWSLISASYLHGSLLHIVFNMIALHQLGPLIIREYGTPRMVAIYTLSGIGGFFVSALFGVRFTIGASAAVCGLIGAALYYGKSRGGTYGKAIYSQVGSWAIGIFIFGFMIPGINNWGHAGGMLSGALAGYLLGYKERSRLNISHRILSTLVHSLHRSCTDLVSRKWCIFRPLVTAPAIREKTMRIISQVVYMNNRDIR